MAGRKSSVQRPTRPLPTIELQILLQLARGPSHGYRMMKQIAIDTDGSFTPGPGSLYVALRRLVERGLICAAGPSATSKRQSYRLTTAGRNTLDEQLEMLDSVLDQARRVGWSPQRDGES